MGKQSPMVTRHQPGPGGSREEEERSEQREAGAEGMLATLSGHGEGRGVGGAVPLQGCHAVPVQLQCCPDNERGHLPVCNSVITGAERGIRHSEPQAHLGRQGEHLLMSYDGKS